MKGKIRIFLCCCLMGSLLLFGCECKEDEKKMELSVTVVNPEEVPKELDEIIQKNREQEIKMSYQDQGYLYLVRGYGEQKTGGYSIQVNGVYLGESGIHVDTSLLGPDPNQKLSEEPSYPYIVLKMEEREEEIFFEG